MSTCKYVVLLLCTAMCGLASCKSSTNSNGPQEATSAVQLEGGAVDGDESAYVVGHITLAIANTTLAAEDRRDTSYRIDIENYAELNSLVAEVLRDTTVNGKLSLAELMAMHKAKDTVGIEALAAHNPQREELDGGTTREMVLHGVEGAIFALDEAHEYSGALIEKLQAIIIEKGIETSTPNTPIEEPPTGSAE